MDIFGDTCAFAFDRPLSFGSFQSKVKSPPRNEPDSTADGSDNPNSHRRAKPPRLPEMRQHGKREVGSNFIPNAVVIASDHSKSVIAGRHIITGNFARLV